MVGAIFENTNLQKSDFRNALGYSIDPRQNKLKNAQFSESVISGLLDSFKIKIE
jgi:uncharacterized protein YjbI with pentapeptide repeats